MMMMRVVQGEAKGDDKPELEWSSSHGTTTEGSGTRPNTMISGCRDGWRDRKLRWYIGERRDGWSIG